ncbi:MAG TPA: phosphopantetheine-binding protein [Kineosporiaceae bacterium]|nr:phosphopantetheine-binding protein [Kineosporiaceae bacterium]
MSRTVPGQEQVEQEIVALVAAELSWALPDGPPPGASARLRDDLLLDSLHLVALQVNVEDHFGVAFDPADEELADAFDTIGSLAQYVRRLLGESPR